MRLIIAGSRSLDELRFVEMAVQKSGWLPLISVVISGGARGIDTLGYRWALSKGFATALFEVGTVEWKVKGNRAYHERNQRMADYGEALLLIWNGKSSGSASMLEKARGRGLQIKQYIVRKQ